MDLTTYLPEVIAAHEAIYPEHTFASSTFGPALVYADKDRIAQMVSTLLTNAIKYSPGKSLVEITLSREGGQIRTSIKDQGSAYLLPNITEYLSVFTGCRPYQKRLSTDWALAFMSPMTLLKDIAEGLA